MPTAESHRTGPTQSHPLLVDIKELARQLSRSVASIQRDDDAGRIPSPIMIGGSKRWRLNEIRAWVRSGCPDRTAWESRWSNNSAIP